MIFIVPIGSMVSGFGIAMKLSAEQFQWVIQLLRLDRGMNQPSHGPSALRVRRVRLGGRATIIPCSGDHARRPVPAVARDVSPSGIALTLPVQLLPGDSFVLHTGGDAEDPASDVPRGLLCRVVRFLPAGDGVFTIGATFIRELIAGPASTARLAQS